MPSRLPDPWSKPLVPASGERCECGHLAASRYALAKGRPPQMGGHRLGKPVTAPAKATEGKPSRCPGCDCGTLRTAAPF